MIYVDPTELRGNSRFPSVLFAVVKELPGLEMMTGADILITPHENEIPDLKDIPPHRKILQMHIDDGLLIQRKSGSDLLGSIRDLPEIEWRMQSWSMNPWLLVTGIHQGSKKQVVVDGKSKAKWRWESISGVLDAWQDRGGSVKHLRSDDDIAWWLVGRERKVHDWLVEPEKLVTKVHRQSLRKVEDNWYSTNRIFPVGIGLEMMASLAKYIVEVWERPPTLANAIALATSDDALKVHGWGKTSLQKVRDWFGITHSKGPLETGAESACWIYNLPIRSQAERRVFVVGNQIIDPGENVVYEVDITSLGDINNPMTLPDGTVVLPHEKTRRTNVRRTNDSTGRSGHNRRERDGKDDGSADIGTPF